MKTVESSQGDTVSEEKYLGSNPPLSDPRARMLTPSHSNSLTSPEALVKNAGSSTSPSNIVLSISEVRSQKSPF